MGIRFLNRFGDKVENWKGRVSEFEDFEIDVKDILGSSRIQQRVDPKTPMTSLTLLALDPDLQKVAQAIKEKEQYELVTIDHPIDWSIYARTGHTGPTIAESMLSVPGFQIRKADKNREAGWVQIHELFRRDPRSGIPKIRIMRTCKNTIKQLMSAKVHPTKPGDINQARNSDGHWDLLDALRYGVMSRPRRMTYEDALLSAKSSNSWTKYRGYFN